jgi:hypothetical protein
MPRITVCFTKIYLLLVLLLFSHSALQNAVAQIEGITLRSAPMTHAFIDSGDILLGVGLSYTKVEDPGYQVSGINPESVISSEQFGFLAIGLADSLAIGVSTNPTEIELKGTERGTSNEVETKLHSSRTYYYIIPTLYQWQKSRIALIWGKGKAIVEENETLNRDRDEYTIGTTGLFGEFYLGDSFSIVPWLSWPYLLFDFSPPSIADVQTPDYGFDGVFHIGEAKLSLSLIFQALDTVDKSATDEELKEEDSEEEKETNQESYSVSVSFVF